MKSVLFLSLSIFLISCKVNTEDHLEPTTNDQQYEYAIVIHGGAGYATPESLGEEGVIAYKAALDSALTIGLEHLEEGANGAETIEAVIRYLEDNPLFNAGRGAALTSDGRAELDASIMSGKDMNAGAVAGLTSVRHPITAARRVMDSSAHVMLAGQGATIFAREQGLEMVPQAFFMTSKQKAAVEKAKKEKKFGTVGCVVLDKEGDLYAGTSTGGIGNKKHGRVGDVPVIGAGTYAKNGIAGVSCTGQGEFFIRLAVAKELTSLMEYKGYSLEEAAEEVIHKQVEDLGAKGGVICLDKKGNVAMEFNTSAMFRAYGNSEGVEVVEIF